MPVNDSSTATSEPLTPKQEALIVLLCSGIHIVTAAKNIGIAEKTAHRWLKLPHFQQVYRAAQQSLFNEALQGLQGKIRKAIDTLDRNMDSEDAPASTQVRAAQIVLEQSIAIYKLSELEDKMAALETYIKQQIDR